MIIYKEPLDRVYKEYIEPILNGKQDIITWWDLFKEDKPTFTDAAERCNYETFKSVKDEALNKTTNPQHIDMHEDVLRKTVKFKNKLFEGTYVVNQYTGLSNDKVFYFPDSKDYINKDRLRELFYDDIMDIIYLNTGEDNLEITNTPIYYKDYNGVNGYLGWHNNCDHPGPRWYLVYNTHGNSSFLRSIDQNTGKMITKWEPQGWSLNYFELGDCDNPFWHCIHSTSHRFSFGLGKKKY